MEENVEDKPGQNTKPVRKRSRPTGSCRPTRRKNSVANNTETNSEKMAETCDTYCVTTHY